jgi:hypothetical protein
MSVAVGDPLYRPYKSWRLDDTGKVTDPWKIYRGIVLKASGNVLDAAGALEDAGNRTGKSFFVEAVGAARMNAKDWEGAIASFAQARKLTSDPAVQARLDFETIACLEALGKKAEVLELAAHAAEKLPPGPRKDLFTQFLPPPPPSPSPSPSTTPSPKR